MADVCEWRNLSPSMFGKHLFAAATQYVNQVSLDKLTEVRLTPRAAITDDFTGIILKDLR